MKSIEKSGVHTFDLTWHEIRTLNDPTDFPRTSPTVAHFEDGIVLRAHDFLTRAKLAECALAIQGTVAEMDFSAALVDATAASKLVGLQLRCIAQIRQRMNRENEHI